MALSVNAQDKIGDLYDLARLAQQFIAATDEIDIWWTGLGNLTTTVVIDTEARNQMPSLNEIEKQTLDDAVYTCKQARDALKNGNFVQILLLAGLKR